MQGTEKTWEELPERDRRLLRALHGLDDFKLNAVWFMAAGAAGADPEAACLPEVDNDTMREIRGFILRLPQENTQLQDIIPAAIALIDTCMNIRVQRAEN